MIHNTRQYRITKAQAAKFAEVLQAFDSCSSAHLRVHPKLIKAQRDALVSQFESLSEEVKKYERLRKTQRR